MTTRAEDLALFTDYLNCATHSSAKSRRLVLLKCRALPHVRVAGALDDSGESLELCCNILTFIHLTYNYFYEVKLYNGFNIIYCETC